MAYVGRILCFGRLPDRYENLFTDNTVGWAGCTWELTMAPIFRWGTLFGRAVSDRQRHSVSQSHQNRIH